MNIQIISSLSSNTISINLDDNSVTQILRFSGGSFYKQNWPCSNYSEALGWAKSLV